MADSILVIDPGKFKSGIAVLANDGSIIEKKTVKTLDELPAEISSLCYDHKITLILIGNGGPGKMIEKKISALGIKASILFINEKGSTLEARWLYWEENKPRGIMRLIPKTLRIPPVPYDDYAAVVIGRRFLIGE